MCPPDGEKDPFGFTYCWPRSASHPVSGRVLSQVELPVAPIIAICKNRVSFMGRRTY
jgi:hypothetical protein